jgi:hypothetical protein
MSIMPISDRLGQSRMTPASPEGRGIRFDLGWPQIVGPVVSKLEKLQGDLPLRIPSRVRGGRPESECEPYL